MDVNDNILGKLLSDNTIGENISALYAEVASLKQAAAFREEIEKVETDYRMMCDFLCRGFHDPDIAKMYDTMRQRLYNIAVGVLVAKRCQTSVAYMRASEQAHMFVLQPDSVRIQLERFVQDEALLDFDNKNIRQERLHTLKKSHYDYINQLFGAILISRPWTKNQGEGFTSLLVSPTIDVKDALLAVSAITLSVMNVFDPQKWCTLVHVYLKASALGCIALAQRALVGWVFSLPSIDLKQRFIEVDETLRLLSAHIPLCEELVEMQKQVSYCCRADVDTAEIQNNIIPTLMENSDFEFTRLGIKEKEEDSIADILGTDDADRRMEKMEQTFKKMHDMQREGADVFFGGFSQMKRFPFFNDMINWFYPYTPTHPLLDDVYAKVEASRSFSEMLFDSPFCDSDKYSFLLALSMVLKQLPADVRNGIVENKMAFGPTMNDEDRLSATFERRIYLQNLYRFYRLNNNRADFVNPFAKATQAPVRFMDHPFIVRIADIWYQDVDTASTHVLGFLASRAFEQHHYDVAATCYRRFCHENPNNFTCTLKLVVSLLNIGEIEEALPLLYKLDFEYPDNRNVSRALAWALLIHKEPEKSLTRYNKLLSMTSALSTDYLNGAYANWATGHIEVTTDCFARYFTLQKKDACVCRDLLRKQFEKDATVFSLYAISQVEQCIMLDTVASRIENVL